MDFVSKHTDAYEVIVMTISFNWHIIYLQVWFIELWRGGVHNSWDRQEGLLLEVLFKAFFISSWSINLFFSQFFWSFGTKYITAIYIAHIPVHKLVLLSWSLILFTVLLAMLQIRKRVVQYTLFWESSFLEQGLE